MQTCFFNGKPSRGPVHLLILGLQEHLAIMNVCNGTRLPCLTVGRPTAGYLTADMQSSDMHAEPFRCWAHASGQ